MTKAGLLRRWRASQRRGKNSPSPTAVIPRESGGSSTPRLIHFIADVAGIPGRPLEPVIGLVSGKTRWRTTTVEVVTSSAPFVVLSDHLHAVWTLPQRDSRCLDALAADQKPFCQSAAKTGSTSVVFLTLRTAVIPGRASSARTMVRNCAPGNPEMMAARVRVPAAQAPE